MPTIGITVKQNFNEAGVAASKFANNAGKGTKKLSKELKKLEQFQADSFIKKNKRIALSVKATTGATKALTTEHRGLERKMQMLIRNGIDPLDNRLSSLRKEYKRTGAAMEKSQKRTVRNGKAFRRVAAIATIYAFGIMKAVNATSALEEQTAKFNTVFKAVGASANKVSKQLVDDYGLSTRESKQLLSSTGDLLTGFKFTDKQALKLSNKVQKLAIDLASFNNVQGGAAAVSAALTKGLLGERESMKTFGIAIREADIKQALFAKGQQHLTGMALLQAKAMITLELATSQSKKAIGDAIRTQDSYANIMRRTKGAIEDTAAGIGKIFMPILAKLVNIIRAGVTWFNNLGDGVKKMIVIFSSLSLGALAVFFAAGKIIKKFKEFRRTLKILRASLASHPLLLLGGILAGLAIMALNSGKSMKELESEILSAEKTSKLLDKQLKSTSTSFETYSKTAKVAAVGTVDYTKSVQRLLKQSPELAKYGITASSSFKDVQKAQKLMSESFKSDQIVKANEQYNKLVDGLSDLKFGLIKAYETYKDDPTTANLANAKKYRALLKRSQVAMQNLGKQTGRSGKEVNKTFTEMRATAGPLGSVFDGMATKAVKGLDQISLSSGGVIKQIQSLMKTVTGISFDFSGGKTGDPKAKKKKRVVVQKDPGFTARLKWFQILETRQDAFERKTNNSFSGMLKEQIKAYDLSGNSAQTFFDMVETRLKQNRAIGRLTAGEFAGSIDALNKMRTNLPIEEYKNLVKEQEKSVNLKLKEIQKLPPSQRIALLTAELSRINNLEKIKGDEKVALVKTVQEKITEVQKVESEKRRKMIFDSAGQVLNAFGGISDGLSGLATAQSSQKIAILDEQFKKEISGKKLTDKQKAKLERDFDKKKAKIEFEGATRAWKLQKQAAIASGASATLSALSTQPFFPAGLAAAALAATMAGINIATVNASKPILSAETGASFVVPDNPRSGRVDNQTVAVNPGEDINITPRGESSNRPLIVNNIIDKRLIYSIMQEGYDTGEVTITTDNLVAF